MILPSHGARREPIAIFPMPGRFCIEFRSRYVLVSFRTPWSCPTLGSRTRLCVRNSTVARARRAVQRLPHAGACDSLSLVACRKPSPAADVPAGFFLCRGESDKQGITGCQTPARLHSPFADWRGLFMPSAGLANQINREPRGEHTLCTLPKLRSPAQIGGAFFCCKRLRIT